MAGAPPPVAMAAEPLPFQDIPGMVAGHARARPQALALIDGVRRLDYATFDAMVDRAACALQRAGLAPCDAIAICAAMSAEYLALYLGAVRAGVTVAPLAPSATPAQLVAMAADAGARLLFTDVTVAAALDAAAVALPAGMTRCDLGAGGGAAPAWQAEAGARPAPVAIDPAWAFNIIYSSGTTGTPKGIVQSHAMRWGHAQRYPLFGVGEGTVTLIATPLYSNTTMTVAWPTLAWGGCLVLLPKFDVPGYLALAERERVTHTMLVPVQYERLMAHPDFDRYDLTSFQVKFCTSAPFRAALKRDVVARWPGALVEFYGLTEGGGTCLLEAHRFPDKLHTVGTPVAGHDIRLIDEEGVEVPRVPGGASAGSGEVVGRSMAMMTGYHNQPAQTSATEWFSPAGERFLRTGDVARFDEDGFLVLMDRRKDVIISGGFNVYPSDLEAVLRGHPAVADVAVVGVPSPEWGETPVAFVVRRPGAPDADDAILGWANAQLGRTQRVSALAVLHALPRSAIGKVLKRELRDRWARRADG